MGPIIIRKTYIPIGRKIRTKKVLKLNKQYHTNIPKKEFLQLLYKYNNPHLNYIAHKLQNGIPLNPKEKRILNYLQFKQKQKQKQKEEEKDKSFFNIFKPSPKSDSQQESVQQKENQSKSQSQSGNSKQSGNSAESKTQSQISSSQQNQSVQSESPMQSKFKINSTKQYTQPVKIKIERNGREPKPLNFKGQNTQPEKRGPNKPGSSARTGRSSGSGSGRSSGTGRSSENGSGSGSESNNNNVTITNNNINSLNSLKDHQINDKTLQQIYKLPLRISTCLNGLYPPIFININKFAKIETPCESDSFKDKYKKLVTCSPKFMYKKAEKEHKNKIVFLYKQLDENLAILQKGSYYKEFENNINLTNNINLKIHIILYDERKGFISNERKGFISNERKFSVSKKYYTLTLNPNTLIFPSDMYFKSKIYFNNVKNLIDNSDKKTIKQMVESYKKHKFNLMFQAKIKSFNSSLSNIGTQTNVNSNNITKRIVELLEQSGRSANAIVKALEGQKT